MATSLVAFVVAQGGCGSVEGRSDGQDPDAEQPDGGVWCDRYSGIVATDAGANTFFCRTGKTECVRATGSSTWECDPPD